MFFRKRFKFEQYFCNGCHDVLMMSVNFKDIAISNIRSVHYRCIINGITKSDSVNLLLNADLIEERGAL